MRFSDVQQNPDPIRAAAFGFAKTKKTWWAGTAAEAGFNVIHLSAERGGHAIFSQLSAAAQSRINVIRIADNTDVQTAAIFMAAFCGKRPFYWHEAEKRLEWVPKEGCIYIDRRRLDRNVVLIIDPWTALTQSIIMKFCAENGIDPADAKKADWEHYRWCGQHLSWILGELMAVQAHLVLVAHINMYEKRNHKDQNQIEWRRKIFVSSSANHGMTMPRLFDEVLRFEMTGPNIFIDPRPWEESDGGGRFLPPVRKPWQDLQFNVLATAARISPEPTIPDVESYFPPVTSEMIAEQQQRSAGLLARPAAPAGTIVPQQAAPAIAGNGGQLLNLGGNKQ